MLMLDSAIKKRFFSETEKRVFLIHAYAVWVFAWLNANQLIQETDLWSLKSNSFAMPCPSVMSLSPAPRFPCSPAPMCSFFVRRLAARHPGTGSSDISYRSIRG